MSRGHSWMPDAASARRFPAKSGFFENVLNRPFLGEKKRTMEIRKKTAFGAIRYFLAGTVVMRARQQVVLIVIREIIEMCPRWSVVRISEKLKEKENGTQRFYIS